MTRDILQGADAEPRSVEADTPDQVHEVQADAVGTDVVVAAPDQPAAEPEIPKSGRRRLGSAEMSSAEPVRRPRPAVPMDAAQREGVFVNLRAEQNLGMGIIGGTLAAVVGAILYAAVTVGTGFQIGWMAIGVGFMVGRTVGVLGKGIDRPFGYLGATLSLVGCLMGNLLSVCVIVAQQQELALSFVLTHLNPAALPELMAVTFHPLDLLFYGLAIYGGYRFAFRRVTPADMARLAPRQAPGDGPIPVV